MSKHVYLPLLVFSLLFVWCPPIQGAPVLPLPVDAWTDEARLVAAQAVVAEAGWDVPSRDAAAVLWVFARRYKTVRQHYPTFASFVRAYSTPLRGEARTIRQRAIRALTADGPVPEDLRANQAAWQRVQRFVRDFSTGRIGDPCQADHFGSPADPPRPQWIRVQCQTSNVFYRLP